MSETKSWVWALFHPRAMAVELGARKLELFAVQGVLNRALTENAELREKLKRAEIALQDQAIRSRLPNGMHLVQISKTRFIRDQDLSIAPPGYLENHVVRGLREELGRVAALSACVEVHDTMTQGESGKLVDAVLLVATR